MKPVIPLLIYPLLFLLALAQVHTSTVYINLSKHKANIDDHKAEVTAGIEERCPPSFPYKNGWLGGDGTVSVPLDATTTLFLFSDSYVGRQKSTSRTERGLDMVANTLAIQRCISSDHSEINYYWNKQYTRKPEPFFKPKHKLYKYWVADAFIVEGTLYVIMENIGPYPDAPPGEIFTFKSVGFTMASINNPYDTPDEWNITYHDLPGFLYPESSIRCHARYKDHIYLFISYHDKALLLVRKKLEDFGNMLLPFEYFAMDGQWKKGWYINDMRWVARSFRCNTVKYHADIDKWIMVLDIWLQDNKISIRIADDLTGPWSDQEVIYTIPERTPGDPAYHANNFCYLARECIQNYNAKTKTLLITYDVNNSDMGYVIDHPQLYTPKVIRVPLQLE